MRRTAAILMLGLFFSCGFIKAPQRADVHTEPLPADSLRSLYLYTDGVKRNCIDNDTLGARRLFMAAIANDSTYAPAYYELAASLVYDSTDRAIDYARRAVGLDSTNKWYLQLYGQSLIVGSRYGEAIPVFEKLVRTERNPEHFRLLAALYDGTERPYSAIAILDSADSQFGRMPYLDEMKRRLLLRTMQYDRALAEAERSVAEAPYLPENHMALGEVYEVTGKDSLAEASYRRGVSADSTSVAAWASLADFYNRRGDYRSYLDVVGRLFRMDNFPTIEKTSIFRRLTGNRKFYREYYPQIDVLAASLYLNNTDNRDVVNLYAGHLISSGRIDQALEIYKARSREANPDMESFITVMEIESYLGHADSVSLYLDRALKLFPENADLYMRRGHLAMLGRRNDEALDSYREALRYATSDTVRSELWGCIGDVWHQRAEQRLPEGVQAESDAGIAWLGRDGGARRDMKRCYEAYDRALEYFGDNASVLNNYAYFLSLEGRDLDRALSMSGRATEIADNNPTFLDTHAWVLYTMGRYTEAKKVMRQAISLDNSGSASLQLHYGDILAALGEKFMAEIYWRKALEKGFDGASIERRIANLEQQQE